MSPSQAYEILGLREGAGEDEIRRAYRDLVKKYHPDQYVNNPLSDLAAEKLKEINEAYDVLTRREAGYQKGSKALPGTPAIPAAPPVIPASTRRISSGCASSFPRTTSTPRKPCCGASPCRTPSGFTSTASSRCAGALTTRRGIPGPRGEHGPEQYRIPQRLRGADPFLSVLRRAAKGGADMCQVCQTLWCLDCCCEMLGGDFIRCC